MIAFCFLFVPIVSGAILEIDESFVSGSVDIIPVGVLLPAKARSIQRARKPLMSYGSLTDNSWKIYNYFESIPVEKRLKIFQLFENSITRAAMAILMSRDIYHRYLVSSMFIDVRILRLLIRFATRKLQKGEKHLKSASDIIDHIQKIYPNESFEYLTPDYVLLWYESLGGGNSIFNGVIPDGGLAEFSTTPTDGDIPNYVLLPLCRWRQYILNPRRERLILTGYEN